MLLFIWVFEMRRYLVAEGEIPLVATKGEEIPRYKQLDSTNRLLILKALCELRAHQDDTVSYINDALKEGNQISSFYKDKIGGDGNGTSYWYDGNKTIGYRLYRELNIYPSKRNSKGKGCLTPPAISSQWETLATNLDEFRKVVDELSSSKVVAEVDVSKTIEIDAIPVLEKLQKNKDRALKQKQQQEMLLNCFTKPLVAGITRSCYTRRPVSYTFVLVHQYFATISEVVLIFCSQLTQPPAEENKNQMVGKHLPKVKKKKTKNTLSMLKYLT
ncbi:DDT domain-containing protein DDR4 [Fagus crenata]